MTMMTFEEKQRMIAEMCEGLKKVMLTALPSAPKEWNGIELRQWLADLAQEKYVMPMAKTHMKNYRNDRRFMNDTAA